jgi:hypothetical protein
MMPYSQQFWHKYHDQATMIKTTQYAPPMRSAPTWTNTQPVNAPIQSYAGWSGAPGSAMAAPQSTPPVYSGSNHVPPQGYAIMPDQPRYQAPQPTEIVNPAAYQSGNGRGY